MLLEVNSVLQPTPDGGHGSIKSEDGAVARGVGHFELLAQIVALEQVEMLNQAACGLRQVNLRIGIVPDQGQQVGWPSRCPVGKIPRTWPDW